MEPVGDRASSVRGAPCASRRLQVPSVACPSCLAGAGSCPLRRTGNHPTRIDIHLRKTDNHLTRTGDHLARTNDYLTWSAYASYPCHDGPCPSRVLERLLGARGCRRRGLHGEGPWWHGGREARDTPYGHLATVAEPVGARFKLRTTRQ